MGAGLVWYQLERGTSILKDVAYVKKASESIALSLANAGVEDPPLHDIQASLAGCGQTGDVANGAVRVLVPELMEELDFGRWQGDGHFNASQIAERGPPTLGQIVRFVRMVSAEKRTVVLLSSDTRRGATAIFAGAVLVLSRPELEANIQALLPRSASTEWGRFPPPFSADGVNSPAALTVQDCLDGLREARDRGWLQEDFDLAGWKFLREKFDSSWIIPGEMLAMGHPSLTAINPKFPGLMLPAGKFDSRQETPQSTPSTTATAESLPCIPDTLPWDEGNEDDIPGEEKEALIVPGLLVARPTDVGKYTEYALLLKDRHFPQKSTPQGDYEACGLESRREFSPQANQAKSFTSVSELQLLRGDCFASYLDRKELGMMVRLNLEREYPDKRYLETFGHVRCEAVEFEDGAAPSKECCRAFIDLCRAHQESCATGSRRAIAVHCKAGLGRTGVQVGAYIAEKYSISGRVVHGWLRLVRPGSVQTPEQERFLRSIGGTVSGSSGNLLSRLKSISWPNFQTMKSSKSANSSRSVLGGRR